MALAAGTRLGAYEITGSLGAGGMGEVYRATDTKLGREVAIKTLPAALAQDHGRLARFEREAKLLAALNHAHIASVYSLDEHEGTQYLVMELVEGETLEEKLKQGALPVEDALGLALQIAEALEAAHDKGVVHRDLKPANVMVTRDGQVKVLDFGLAKAFSGDPNEASPAHSPALSVAMTQQGLILGTAGYMSPEQASGQATDPRADIWAFGVVLYEMLTGLPPFSGESVPHVLAAVLKTEPDWNHLPRNLHPRLKLLLDHCLVKKPRGRLHSIADARIEIEDVLNDPRGGRPDLNDPHGRRSARSMIVWTAAVAVVVLLGVAGIEQLRSRPVPEPPPTRLSIAAIGDLMPQMAPAVSPDGRRLVYVSTEPSGGSRLWVRDLDGLAPHALAGTEDAAHPFWAPDGSAIGFVAAGKLKRVDADGGEVQTLADGAFRSGATWSSTGVILFVTKGYEFATVPATGGPVSTVLTARNVVQEGARDWPSFLPDGRHFIFFDYAVDGTPGVYAGSLGSQTTKLVLPGDFGAVFAAPDYLVFGRRDGLVFAQHFDLKRLKVTGEPFLVAEGVWSSLPNARVSVSATGGVLAYINASVKNTELAWFDRSGRPLGTVGEPGPYEGQSARISPDDADVAVTHDASVGGGVWVTRLADGTTRRLTLEPGAYMPIWSRDASRILFESLRGANGNPVSIQDARGSGPAKEVGPIDGLLWDWSPDGQRIVFGKGQPMDLWILPVAGGDAVPFARSSFNKTQAQVSPDGNWIAYTSLDEGHDEVYVDSFPVASNRRQLSVGGGMQPRWRRDGAELFYLAPDQTLMAVPVTTSQGHFDAGRATPLFQTRLLTIGSQISGVGAFYDVTPDGQRFLLNETPADSGPPLTVVLDWAAGSTRPK